LYVSPAGSDSNPGTSALPFRQIRAGVAAAGAGDTVIVGDGTYLGFDVVSKIGTAGAPITIRAPGRAADVTVTTDRSDNRDSIRVSFSSYVVLDGLRGSGAIRAAVRIDQSGHVTIRNGTFGNNATWGIFTDFSDDLLIENNECFGSGTQHGIYVSNSGDRPVLRGNRVHDNHGGGIQLNADASQGGDGLITGALLEGNVIWGNGVGGGAAINLDGVQDSTVRNNLLYGNHASGIANFQIDGAAGPKGMRILNNTIDMASDGRWAILFKSSTGANSARNNVLYNRNSAHGGIVYGDATDVADLDSASNVLDAVSPDDGGTRFTLAQWQAQGHEIGSISIPLVSLFVNPGLDYRLPAGSAAIDHGIALADVPNDIEGRSRPAGPAPDIGAFEFPVAAGAAYYTVTPCRLVDTRSAAAGPALSWGTTRAVAAAGSCGIPAGAISLSVNVTITVPSADGYATVFPTFVLVPIASTVNFRAGQTRANNAIVPLDPTGRFFVLSGLTSGSVHLVVDVNGYFL
jgi:parallel beta-helix repeat protein